MNVFHPELFPPSKAPVIMQKKKKKVPSNSKQNKKLNVYVNLIYSGNDIQSS